MMQLSLSLFMCQASLASLSFHGHPLLLFFYVLKRHICSIVHIQGKHSLTGLKVGSLVQLDMSFENDIKDIYTHIGINNK